MKNNSPLKDAIIGIFDSGVGGFSVAKEIRKITDTDIVYYGDCARAPYGNRQESEIINFIKEDIKFLQEKKVTHYVNACNSMSVLTTDVILKECGISPDRYVDMIRAFSARAVFYQTNKVLVIATVATIRSGTYQEELTKKGVTVCEYAYTDLAEAIERNGTHEELYTIIERSIVYAKEVGATHILYGCTHYPLVHQLFFMVQKEVGWHGDFIDPSIYVAEEIKKWKLGGKRNFIPYSSKDTPAFINNVIKFL